MTVAPPTLRRPKKGTLDTLLLVTPLVCNTLYQSKLGGEGTIWNTISFAACFLFVLRNFRRKSSFAPVFMLPVFFLALSSAVNVLSLGMSGLRTIAATAVGFALFALAPVNLNLRLLERLVRLYVVTCVAVSVGIFAAHPNQIPFADFHENPNSAAQLFYACGALALFFFAGPVKWVLVILDASLLIATQARTASTALAASIIAFILIAKYERMPALGTIVTRVVRFIPVIMVAVLAIQALLVQYVAGLFARFEQLRDYQALTQSRVFIWIPAVGLALSSTTTILFGIGPATIDNLLGRGTHSSYVQAFASHGALFVVASLVAMWLWIYRMTRSGHHAIIVVAVPLLFYGITETFLFTGFATLWYLLAFIGIYLRSTSVAVSRAPAWRVDRRATRRRVPPALVPGPHA